MIFCIRDRASGWYVTHNAFRRETGGFHLVKGKVFAVMITGDDKEAQRCCIIAQELFGENKKNGFDLYPERVV
jgi:hypothetical protein